MNRWFEQAKLASGNYLSPQRLREWFACEMAELGVQDRFIDAFCGRMPRSILARHYTDYSPERLKRIYDNAGISVRARGEDRSLGSQCDGEFSRNR